MEKPEIVLGALTLAAGVASMYFLYPNNIFNRRITVTSRVDGVKGAILYATLRIYPARNEVWVTAINGVDCKVSFIGQHFLENGRDIFDPEGLDFRDSLKFDRQLLPSHLDTSPLEVRIACRRTNLSACISLSKRRSLYATRHRITP